MEKNLQKREESPEKDRKHFPGKGTIFDVSISVLNIGVGLINTGIAVEGFREGNIERGVVMSSVVVFQGLLHGAGMRAE